MNRLDDNGQYWRHAERAHKRGKIFGGLLLIGVGCLFIMRETGYDLPNWLFTWKTLLIAIGLFSAVKHGFSHIGWLIPVAIGSAFLFVDFYPEIRIRPFIVPGILILVGLVVLFRPSGRYRRKYRRHWQQREQYEAEVRSRYDCYGKGMEHGEDYLDSTNIFGGSKKVVISKSFKGGDVVTVFGGTEINLMQADFESNARLEVTQVFGGTRLIIPAHWQVKSNVTTILGSTEDKRPANGNLNPGETKILELTGTTVMGGIEINSF